MEEPTWMELDLMHRIELLQDEVEDLKNEKMGVPV
jgi:hypothetical protein